MRRHGQAFDLALTVTRAGNVFTTHTPVEAGVARFAPDLVAKYLRSYAEHELGIPLHSLLALGRRDAHDAADPFNMAYLALRGSGVPTASVACTAKSAGGFFSAFFHAGPRPKYRFLT